MECENLPIEKASEPAEEAHQPARNNNILFSKKLSNPKKSNVTFSEDTNCNETLLQGSGKYKEALSQPGAGLSHRQRLQWLQKRRHAGLWANCDNCSRWRYLPHVLDAHELPAKWYCKMNPDTSANNCSIPETPLHLRDEEDLIHAEYSAGSVVWARLAGYPAWPAMVDDCPDTEQFYWLDGFSDIPTYYNVVFFDEGDVTRAWITPENLMPYGRNRNLNKLTASQRKYKKRLDAAKDQADDADSLPVANRLAKYSFIARYPGSINKPKKVSKKDLQKYQNKLKRKFNIEFDIESASESDDDYASCNKVDNTKKDKLTGAKGSKPMTSNGFDDFEPSKKIQDARKDKLKASKKSKTPESFTNQANTKKQRTLRKTNNMEKTEDLTEDLTEDCNNNNIINEKSKKQIIDIDDNKSSEDIADTGAPESNEIDKEVKENTEKPSDDSKAIFKQPIDSMTVQVGSTDHTIAQTALSEALFDNDTSKTYVPDTETETESETITTLKDTEIESEINTTEKDTEIETESETITAIKKTITKMRASSASPCSDDFEF